MSLWADRGMPDRVVAALRDIPYQADHPFGRPWLTSYQLVIRMELAEPGLTRSLGFTIGGEGAGSHTFASYLAGELRRRLYGGDPIAELVEGAYLSSQHVNRLVYNGPAGHGPITSTLTGSGFDLSMFRLR